MRWHNGKLKSVSHCVGGLAQGVSVSWHSNGQIALYREMNQDVVDGREILWDEDGTLRSEKTYIRGRQTDNQQGNQQTPSVNA